MRITITIEEGGQAAPVVTVQGTGVEAARDQPGQRRAGPALDGGPASAAASDRAGPTAQDQGFGAVGAAGQALDAGAPPEPMPMGAGRLAVGPGGGATTGQAVDAGAAPSLMGAGFSPSPLVGDKRSAEGGLAGGEGRG